MNAKERLVSHEQLVELMLKHQYIPQKSQDNFLDMLGALRELNPKMKLDPGCAGCMQDLAQRAMAHIRIIKAEIEAQRIAESNAKFMTFPAEKKKPGRQKK